MNLLISDVAHDYDWRSLTKLNEAFFKNPQLMAKKHKSTITLKNITRSEGMGSIQPENDLLQWLDDSLSPSPLWTLQCSSLNLSSEESLQVHLRNTTRSVEVNISTHRTPLKFPRSVPIHKFLLLPVTSAAFVESESLITYISKRIRMHYYSS